MIGAEPCDIGNTRVQPRAIFHDHPIGLENTASVGVEQQLPIRTADTGIGKVKIGVPVVPRDVQLPVVEVQHVDAEFRVWISGIADCSVCTI